VNRGEEDFLALRTGFRGSFRNFLDGCLVEIGSNPAFLGCLLPREMERGRLAVKLLREKVTDQGMFKGVQGVLPRTYLFTSLGLVGRPV